MARGNREIERKFTLPSLPAEAKDAGTQIEQGYLVAGGVAPQGLEIRVRRLGGRDAVLTVKKPLAGNERIEVEIPLTESQFATLWALTGGRQIMKRRRRVDLADDLVAECDEYEGPLAGLRVVEVEFPTVERSRDFKPPDWFGAEVTGNPAYSNARLAGAGTPPKQDK